MYNDSKRTCRTVVLLIKPFVWSRPRWRHHRGLLKLPIVSQETKQRTNVCVQSTENNQIYTQRFLKAQGAIEIKTAQTPCPTKQIPVHSKQKPSRPLPPSLQHALSQTNHNCVTEANMVF